MYNTYVLMQNWSLSVQMILMQKKTKNSTNSHTQVEKYYCVFWALSVVGSGFINMGSIVPKTNINIVIVHMLKNRYSFFWRLSDEIKA